jgi:hypothetical protein
MLGDPATRVVQNRMQGSDWPRFIEFGKSLHQARITAGSGQFKHF